MKHDEFRIKNAGTVLDSSSVDRGGVRRGRGNRSTGRPGRYAVHDRAGLGRGPGEFCIQITANQVNFVLKSMNFASF